jgi:hypothetical protein
MDVITIDSSDDNGAASVTIGKEHTAMTSALRDVLNIQSDDDASSISSDDVWKIIGLSSRAKTDDSLTTNDELAKVFQRRCGFGPSGRADESQQAFEDSSVSSSDLGFKETQFIPSNDCDESSVSSADSIWDKPGLPQRSKRIVVAPPHIDGRSISVNHPISKSDRARMSESDSNERADSNPPVVPLPIDAAWRIVLLMDHREFGCANNFLNTVQTRINKQLGGKFAEITTLPSADYMFVSRLISNATGEVMDERVLDMVIERKNVKDVCQCLISDSKSECDLF